jgi:hypothetical protein
MIWGLFDMAIIGFNSETGMVGDIRSSGWGVGLLSKYPYTPSVNESISSFHVYGRTTSAAQGDVFASVYDITSGVQNAPLVGSTAVTMDVASNGDKWVAATGLAIPLVAGNSYAIHLTTSATIGVKFYRQSDVGAITSGGGANSPLDPFTANATEGNIDYNYAFYATTEAAVQSGPTITGPDTTTEGAVTVQTGTLQDTITTQSLISGSYSIEQTIDSATTGTLTYNAESGVNQCTPSTPVSGVPLEPTIAAAGITPYVVQQEADDGTNPPATRNITLNPEATHEVIQTMAVVANTTPDQSVFGTNIIVVEDDMQAYVPKTANGMTITWAADGTFSTGLVDQTEVIDVAFFSPATGQWSCIALTIQNSSIVSSRSSFDFPNFQFPILDTTH